MITIQSIPCVCMCITRVFARVFVLFYSFLDRVHLQKTPSQDFINTGQVALNMLKALALALYCTRHKCQIELLGLLSSVKQTVLAHFLNIFHLYTFRFQKRVPANSKNVYPYSQTLP